MTEALNLIAKCRGLGLTLASSPEGKLRVSPAGKLPDDLREELKRHKSDLLALLTMTPVFPCPACSGQIRLEPAIPEELPTRIWSCPSCRAWGAIRPGAKCSVVWLSSKAVH